jgi:hypothetical protein
MLGRQPIVDAQNAGASDHGNPPSQIAVERGRAEQMAAFVKIENVPIAS